MEPPVAAGILVLPQRMPARDANGRAVVGYIRVYTNQTTTPVAVYTTSALNVAHSQPITSDDAGVFPIIWYDGAAVTMAYEGADGTTQTVDGVTASTSAIAAALQAYSGAVSYTLDTTTTTDADPTAGKMKLNHATPSSATFLYFDNLDADGNTNTAWLDHLDDSNSGTDRGRIIIRSEADANALAFYRISGAVVDGTGYRKVPVVAIAATTFADEASVIVGFAPSGPTGLAATVTAGTATALASTASPTVTNSGTPEAAEFDFGIPAAAPPGKPYTFSISTGDADPGAGTFRFDNATPASITYIFIDNADAAGNTQTAWLDSIDDSTNTIKGELTFYQRASNVSMTLNVTGMVTDGTGYRKIVVTHVSGSTLFTDGAEIGVLFSRAGNKGTDGAGVGDVVGPASSTAGSPVVYDGTSGKLVKMGAINENIATVASHATTADIWAVAGNLIDWTGTATTTAFPTAPQAGAERDLLCAAACSFVNGANLIVPGGGTYVASANDRVRVRAITTTQHQLTIAKANGTAVVGPTFGSAIGDIVASITKQTDFLPCTGGKYLRASYSALSSVIGTYADRPISGSYYQSSFKSGWYACAACTDSSGKFGYVAMKDASYSSSGNTVVHRQTSTSTAGTALTSNILTTTQDEVTAIASNGSYIMASVYGAYGSYVYHLKYAALDADGQMTGSWATTIPTGLTQHLNGFGVINGLFWVSYNVGGVPTDPRIAWGANPAALTISTPTGTSAANSASNSALMFFDGTNYNFWSGSSQFFTGTSLGSLVRDAAINPLVYSNWFGGGGAAFEAPTYSKSTSKAVQINGSQKAFKIANFGADGTSTEFYPNGNTALTTFSADFMGEELYMFYSDAGTYKVAKVDFATDAIIGSAYAPGTSGYIRAAGNGLVTSGSSPGFLQQCSYDISTTFVVPAIAASVGTFQIRAT